MTATLNTENTAEDSTKSQLGAVEEFSLSNNSDLLPITDYPFTKKNDWILNQVEYCGADLGIKDVDSTCLYYDVFDKVAM